MAADLSVSGTQTTRRSESDIRINFNNINQIISASNTIGASSQSQYYSADGGVTWNQTTLPLSQGDSSHSDPAVDWTSDGTAWAITIGIQGAQNQVRLYKSVDSGATWTFDSTVSGTQTNVDKNLMWIDHSAASPHRDNIYVTWHNGGPSHIARKAGASGAWQTPVQVSGAETSSSIGGDVTTNSAGDVFAFWPDTSSRNLFVAKSTDGGTTFGKPVTIGTTFAAYEIAIPAMALRQALIYLSGGAFLDVSNDLVFAVWVDLSGESGCTSGGGPGTNATSSCKSRVWFSRSTDGGATWGATRMLNNQASKNDRFNPRMALDEVTGELVVIYYDTVNDASRIKTDVWMQRSSDFGVTWTSADAIEFESNR